MVSIDVHHLHGGAGMSHCIFSIEVFEVLSDTGQSHPLYTRVYRVARIKHIASSLPNKVEEVFHNRC